MDALKDPKLNIIPIGDDFKGCKVLMILRSRDVLSREMCTQKEFKLEVLPEGQALSLLVITTPDAKDPKLTSIASKIMHKCAGLPLLILKVARDL